MPVVVVGDWDADGFVSTAEIVFSQEVVGAYPVKGRRSVVVFPATPKTILSLADTIIGLGGEEGLYLVVLDIAFSSRVKDFIQRVKNVKSYVIYVDHHIPTHLYYNVLERLVDELVVGKKATAYLVSTLLKSLGIRLSERLRKFVEVVTCLESGARHSNTRLVQLVTAMSKAVSLSRNAVLWEKVVRWLSSPLTHVTLPFSVEDAKKFAKSITTTCDEKGYALELAPSAVKLFGYRLVRLRKHPVGCRFSAIVAAIARTLKAPTLVYSEERGLLAVKTRDDKAFAISMKLQEKGLAEEIMGHERLAIVRLRKGVNYDTLMKTLKNIIIEVG